MTTIAHGTAFLIKKGLRDFVGTGGIPASCFKIASLSLHCATAGTIGSGGAVASCPCNDDDDDDDCPEKKAVEQKGTLRLRRRGVKAGTDPCPTRLTLLCSSTFAASYKKTSLEIVILSPSPSIIQLNLYTTRINSSEQWTLSSTSECGIGLETPRACSFSVHSARFHNLDPVLTPIGLLLPSYPQSKGFRQL